MQDADGNRLLPAGQHAMCTVGKMAGKKKALLEIRQNEWKSDGKWQLKKDHNSQTRLDGRSSNSDMCTYVLYNVICISIIYYSERRYKHLYIHSMRHKYTDLIYTSKYTNDMLYEHIYTRVIHSCYPHQIHQGGTSEDMQSPSISYPSV